MIEIKITSPEQLLNSMDPAPFRNRDLDDKAADYIIAAAEELRVAGPMQLMIDLPAEAESRELTHHLPAAVQNSFAYRATCARRELRDLFRVGRISLAIGLVVMAMCIVIVQLIEASGDETTLSRTFEQGLFIAGWVAIWRPIEIFLYDWWPLKRRIDLLDRLSNMTVGLRVGSPNFAYLSEST